jgi:hypothetical protein
VDTFLAHLKHKFGLKLRWRMGKNGLRLIVNFGRKSPLVMWIHYWQTQTQIWIEIAITDGKNGFILIINFRR